MTIETCDCLVLGSGAGGLAAAFTAAHLGLRTVLVEKAARVGGTTAWSGGWMWVPGNPLARAAGIVEDPDAALAYLREVIAAPGADPRHFDEPRLRDYLAQAPQAIEFFARASPLAFIDGNAIPDFKGHLAQAALGGRSVCAAAFDARRLGAAVELLEPPLREGMPWGLQIAAGAELRTFLRARRDPRAALAVARRLLAHGWDLLRHGRCMRLVNGNALAGALLCGVIDKGGQVRTRHEAQALLTEPGPDGRPRVIGAQVQGPRGVLMIHARHGVVLACGGFPHDEPRKRQWIAHADAERSSGHLSAAAPGNTGDGLRMAEAVGAALAHPGADLCDAAALAPVSRVPRAGRGAHGGHTHWPHLFERAKPGLIAVLADGQRFVNEADAYHDFVRALLEQTAQRLGPAAPPQAWLVADHRFVRQWGLGAARPAPFGLRTWLANGYLRRGRDWGELAQACGIDPVGLARTVQRYNGLCAAGVDVDFQKGQTPYNRIQGDLASVSATQPNACMAPLVQAPFYAVRVLPGSLGTFAGIRVDAHARALAADKQPIVGLYVAGNDQASVMGGHYPSGGITLGPALTFGWVAACHAAAQAPTGRGQGLEPTFQAQ